MDVNNSGPPFSYQILSTRAEAPLALRFFTTAVKTDSKGRIITGPNSDPVKNIVGPEAAGERGGLERFTKIMFGAGYIDGRPDPGTRIDPNNPQVSSGNQKWPNRRTAISQPAALACPHHRRQEALRRPCPAAKVTPIGASPWLAPDSQGHQVARSTAARLGRRFAPDQCKDGAD